jgi:hypothetical protein
VVFDGRVVATRSIGATPSPSVRGTPVRCSSANTARRRSIPPGWRLSVEPTGGLLLEEVAQ